jgi:hypothetical protein
MEVSLLRPLPPFRAKPLRKPLVPKSLVPKSPGGDSRKTSPSETSVKARRHPVKLARPNAAPSLKVLNPA